MLMTCLSVAQEVSTEIKTPQGNASDQKQELKSVLTDLVQEALDKNPSIQAASARVAALRHRVPQVKSMPDPNVSIGWAGDLAPFKVQRGDPSSYRGINVSQQIPYSGKLRLKGEIADRDAEAAVWNVESTKRVLVAEVKVAYFEYLYTYQAIETINKNKELLVKLAKITEARYSVGKGIQQDIIKAQIEISRIQQRLTILGQQRNTAKVRLNTLLLRDPESPLDPPAMVELTELPYKLDELYKLAAAHDTESQQQKRMGEKNEKQIALAQREYLPDFTIGYMYQQRPGLPDMHGFTFGINVPIFYKTKQRESVLEATQELLATRKDQENRQTTLRYEVKEKYLAAQAASELMRLYTQAVVPQSSLALESSMASYEVGTTDFLNVLSNFTTILDYQTEYFREYANRQSTLARLEPLVGVELVK